MADAREPDDFESLVARAIDRLPDEFQAVLAKVAVIVSDLGAEVRAYGQYFGDGVAHERYEDRIVIYRDTLERDFGHDRELLARQVERTLRHELAHHLGWDEEGWAALDYEAVADRRFLSSRLRSFASAQEDYPAPPAVRRSRRPLQLRGADVSGESLSQRGARVLRLLPLALAIGIAAIAIAGCGGSDKTDSISSEAQKRIEQGNQEAKKGIEKAKEEVKKGFNEAEEATKKGVENGKGQTSKTIENAKKEAEEGIEKGKAEAEKAIKEAEQNYGN
jgi:predicted Zn-dependent protease with MMP-like domain